jgi:hypothetical protein
MKTTLLKLTAFLLILASISSSCNPEEEPDVNEVKSRPYYPRNVSFEEYSLDGTSCQWANLPYDEQVIVINSKEELEKFITCTEGSFPEIDFFNNTLLLVSGEKNMGIHEVVVEKFKQMARNQYELEVKVSLDELKPDTKWCSAFTTNKIHKENFVELKLTTIAHLIIKLLNQPLEVIQATILGKWQVDYVAIQTASGPVHYFPSNTYIEIFKEKVVITGDGLKYKGLLYPDSVNLFTYYWEFKQVHYFYPFDTFATYVMQKKDYLMRGWFFDSIYDGKLTIAQDYEPDVEGWTMFGLVRINDFF